MTKECLITKSEALSPSDGDRAAVSHWTFVIRKFLGHWWVIAGSLVISCFLFGCESAGHFSLLGYTTKPNYNECIHTVYVPQFNSQIFVDTTRRSLPVDVTKAVIREIESKTPFKVVSNRDQADTELSGTLLMLSKNLLNRNQLNEIREAETVLTAAIVWKDLRTGEILSKPRKGAPDLTTPGIPALEIPDIGGYLPAAAPTLPLGTPDCDKPIPVLVTGTGQYIPEVGQSNLSAYQKSVNQLAIQIVSQMEKPW
jgi:lipopolysaccharide assembly LptE-like protein